MDSNFLWWIEALVGFGVLGALQYGLKKIITHTQSRIGKICMPPLTSLIWALGFLYFVDLLGHRWGLSIILNYLSALRKTVVIGAFLWLFFRWKTEIEKNLQTKKVDITTVQMIGRLVTLAMGVITALIIMQIFGVNTAPLLAFGSIGAASLGFAGKDVMANFCSGIMLHITRPFVKGDQIHLPEKNLEGIIEEIGWFRTSIRDTEKRAVYLPNNFFSTMLVTNISRITRRRIKQKIRIPLSEVGKISDVVKKIRELISRFPGVDAEYPIHVYLHSFGDYACEIEIEAFSNILDLTLFNRFQQDLLLAIQTELQAMDIPLALPTLRQIS